MMRDLEVSLANALSPLDETNEIGVVDQTIGDVLVRARKLTQKQVGDVTTYQRANGGIRFGDAAVALGLIGNDDVLWALSQQFHYPYALDPAARDRSELVVATDPFSAQAEAIRDLRSQLLMGVLGADQPRRALAIVSPNKGDGKTFFAANMAVALSQLGSRTLLVDADMRTPRQHQVFGVDSASGLSNLLSGRADSAVTRAADLPSLFVLPVGTVPPNPLELVQGVTFRLLMQEFLKRFDHVLVDTPAAVHGADVRVIAATCGAALVIGRQGKTPLASMKMLVDALGKGPSQLAGVVMNQH
jgi:protein-tyrosine kinase